MLYMYLCLGVPISLPTAIYYLVHNRAHAMYQYDIRYHVSQKVCCGVSSGIYELFIVATYFWMQVTMKYKDLPITSFPSSHIF